MYHLQAQRGKVPSFFTELPSTGEDASIIEGLEINCQIINGNLHLREKAKEYFIDLYS